MLSEKNQDIKILTVQEVAGLLRVHRSTVSRFAQTGELKSYRVGNRRLFKDRDVLRLADGRYILVGGRNIIFDIKSKPKYLPNKEARLKIENIKLKRKIELLTSCEAAK